MPGTCPNADCRRDGLALEDAPTSASASPSGRGRCGSLTRIRRIKRPRGRRRPHDSKERSGRASRATAPPEQSDSPWDARGRDRVWGRPHSRGRAPSLTRRSVRVRQPARHYPKTWPVRSSSRWDDDGRAGAWGAARLRACSNRLKDWPELRSAETQRTARRLRVVRLAAGSPGGEGVESGRPRRLAVPPRLFRLGCRHNGLYNPALESADKQRAALASLLGERRGRTSDRRITL